MVNTPTKMYVLKRDGSKQEVQLDKITLRIKKQCHGLNMDFIDPLSITLKVAKFLYPEITTKELGALIADAAAMMATDHSDYALLVVRIVVANLHKDTKEYFSDVIYDLYNTVNQKPIISDFHYKIVMDNANLLNSSINYERDHNYSYYGFKTLEQYLLKINGKIVERPQHLLMRVSVGIHGDDIPAAIETYNFLSEGYFTHARNTLFNAATCKPQLSSSFILNMSEDSIEGIFKSVHDCALISKSAGVIGVNIHNIRAKGTYVSGTNGYSNGLVPMLRVLNNTVKFVNQDVNKSPGSFTIYLEPWHSDIFEFLNLKKNTGMEEFRARDLFYALWIPDLFMRRVEKNVMWSLMCPHQCSGLSDCWGDEFEKLYEKYENEKRYVRQVNAQKLWYAIIVLQIETGSPYMLYKDTCNSKSNQKNLGTIKGSNLCTEIIEYTSPDEIAVGNSAFIAVDKFVKFDKSYDFGKLKLITKVVTKNLNKIIDINSYPVTEAKDSNLRHRPIGIGVQGLADVFILMRIPFESKAVKEINIKIFETIYYGALEASLEIAKIDGVYSSYHGSPISQGQLQYDMWNVAPTNLWDWNALKMKISKYGIRNSLLLAAGATVQILGNNGSIEPYTSNFYTLAGEFKVVNPHLLKDLIELNLWNDVTKNQIITDRGSVQNVFGIPDQIKVIYKTAWEIPQKVILDMATDRGAFIDQSQSLNVHIEKPNYAMLTSMHFYGWKKGLKTGMHYLQMMPNQFPVNQIK